MIEFLIYIYILIFFSYFFNLFLVESLTNEDQNENIENMEEEYTQIEPPHIRDEL